MSKISVATKLKPSYFLSSFLSDHKKADNAGKIIIAANILTKNIYFQRAETTTCMDYMVFVAKIQYMSET